MSFRVDCIGMDQGVPAMDRVITIGGTKSDGRPWRLSATDAIAGLENGSWVLHVEGPNMEVVLLVVASSGGKKYLTAERHPQGLNLLLGLPECSPVPMPRPDADALA